MSEEERKFLEIVDLKKGFGSGETRQEVLRGMNFSVAKGEFCVLLGPSGSGKSTLLNIIGGIDSADSGYISINGDKLKDMSEKKLTQYRRKHLGYVFQMYNLIANLNVKENIEVGAYLSDNALDIDELLHTLGLYEHRYKLPNQLSGGQQQRVSIGRAIVKNPDILLCDEPTGALDTETSIQIMELLKEISKDRLIIMVTHNPELARDYSTRIVRLLDGVITDDSNPYSLEDMEADIRAKEAAKVKTSEKKIKKSGKKQKTSMSFFTALSLSFNNLMTKKTRTILTAFAGSIGIIGIAMILSISNGIQLYIDRVQRDTLSSYPITLQAEAIDISSMVSSMTGNSDSEEHEDKSKIYSNDIMGDMINTMVKEVKSNNLSEFKKYIENGSSDIKSYVSDIQYSYDVPLNIYMKDTSNGVEQLNPGTMFDSIYGEGATSASSSMSSGMGMGMFSNSSVWNQLLGNQQVLDEQYDVLAGHWPENFNEVVLVADKNNEVDDYTLYSLGLKDPEEVRTLFKKMMVGESYETKKDISYTFDEILDTEFKLVMPTDMYKYNDVTGTWDDYSKDDKYMTNVVNNGTDIKVCGIIRPNDDAVSTSLSSGIGYTSKLTEYIIEEVKNSEIAKAQLADTSVDVFTGVPFDNDRNTEITMDDVNAYMATLSPEESAQMQAMTSGMSDDQILQLFSASLKARTTDATLDSNKSKLGITDLDTPSQIDIYATDFDSKEKVQNIIKDYNKLQQDDGKEENVINYTDYVGIMMSSVSTIINAISYVLIAFVAISLIVSSIMIGIITYISVLERTKEIGVLRSIGASKKDVSRIFNAETLIEGFVSGALGIVVTLLLCIPANALIKHLTDISNVAQLPVAGGVILIIISMFLTFIAGLIPAKLAAKKDPVVALRSE